MNGVAAFFVGDDFDFLVLVQRMDGPGDAWGTSFWGEWEPLWYLGFYFDFALWGLSPQGYHASSLFWFALAVLLLFRLVRDLWPAARVAPWAAALLFASHPLHDEAVTYLAARGHPMSLALALLALWAWACTRRSGGSPALRGCFRAIAFLAALLAALAKETALVLPAWVVALELCVFGGLRVSWATLRPALRGGALFLGAGAVYFALRGATVGFDSDKLSGPAGGPWEMATSFLADLPEYALLGGLPFPCAFLGRGALEPWRPLGWLMVAAVALPAVGAAVVQLRRDRRVSRPLGLYLLALVVVAVSLAPVFWADLGLRRRYLYTSSAGAALAAAVVLEWIAARRARLAWTLLVTVVAAGAAGLSWRNDLYVRAGRITRGFVETVRGAPLDRPAPRRNEHEERRIGLVTLPRYLGGDDLSGAYVLHRTDARSAVRLAGIEPDEFGAALHCHFADDYRARASFESREALNLTVTFATERAYRGALERNLAEDREGRLLSAVRARADDASRTIEYKVLLTPGLASDSRSDLYLYSDGRFSRLTPGG